MSTSLRAFKGITLFSLLPLVAACTEATSYPEKLERPVQVQRVTFQSEDASREFVGVVRARYETDLGFRILGKITTRIVNVGDRVRTGDVMARLDPEDLKLQVASAEAELAAARASLVQTTSDEQRYSTLRARGYATVADAERKQAAKEEAEGRLERAQRALDLARNKLGYAELRADADGIITATLAEPGQVIAVGQTVVRLARCGEMEAVVALPETWLGEAREARATVKLWAGPERRFAARLRELSPQADPMTRTYAARFTIEHPDSSVALGMTATVTLTQVADASLAKLPLAAILNRGTGPSVFVVDKSNELELRPVTVASFTADAALVISDLKEGERIVTLGVQKLEPGQKVRAVEPN